MDRLIAWRSFASLAVAVVLALFFGCGDRSEQKPADVGKGQEPVERQEEGAGREPVRIGVILPLSGALADYGESTLAGIEMARDEINKAGGVAGRKIELVVENNENDTTKSADALRKLVGLKKALAVVGPITSTNCLAIVRDAQRKGTVLITPTGTNDTITGHGDFIFRACFNDSFQGAAMAKFAREDLRIESAVPFQDTTSDYSVGLCRSFAERFEELGGKVPATLSYKQGDTDFTPQLRKLREMGAGGVFVPGYPPELPLIVNQARELGLEAHLLGADGWDDDSLVDNSGERLVGSFFSAAFSTDVSTPELEAFMTLAGKRGIKTPGSFEALGYDSVGLIAEAARRAGAKALSGDLRERRVALRDALAAIEDYKGATGSIAMQASGDPLKSLVVLRFEKAEGGGVEKRFVKVVNP
ncbi:MAG TPA: ABC transporter substrate-binding protein [Sumerlaeia bacterium]|nr:ABC transporter substrate-binding protein [Sumerlaeia bacterium]